MVPGRDPSCLPAWSSSPWLPLSLGWWLALVLMLAWARPGVPAGQWGPRRFVRGPGDNGSGVQVVQGACGM